MIIDQSCLKKILSFRVRISRKIKDAPVKFGVTKGTVIVASFVANVINVMMFAQPPRSFFNFLNGKINTIRGNSFV